MRTHQLQKRKAQLKEKETKRRGRRTKIILRKMVPQLVNKEEMRRIKSQKKFYKKIPMKRADKLLKGSPNQNGRKIKILYCKLAIR